MLGIREALSKECAEKIISSGLFDAEWYVNKYPDVRLSGLNPLRHYLRIGYGLDRDPGPKFCGSAYLSANPDVLAADISPLLHYINNGIKEGRTQRPVRELLQEDMQTECVDVVIPVHNALVEVRRLIASIESARNAYRLSIHLVNDCSDKSTSDWLENRTKILGWNYISNPRNLGYAGSVNEGIKHTKSQFVCILNSDTEVLDGWVDRLVYVAQKTGAAIVGPLSNAAGYQTIKLPDEKSPDFQTISALQKLLQQSNECFPEVSAINGFCMLVRRSLFESIGYLDSTSFPKGYGEETDFCIRARDAGHKICVDTRSFIYHAKSKSFGDLDRKNLTVRGDKVLREKWGGARINETIQQLEGNSELKNAIESAERYLIENSWAGQSTIVVASVAFITSVGPGGGGAQSMFQEAQSLRRLGISCHVYVPEAYVAKFHSAYSKSGEDQNLIRPIGDLHPQSYQVIIATNWQSVVVAAQSRAKNKNIKIGYYVQDYEALFYESGSLERDSAEQSYLSPDVDFIFAKSLWLQEKIKQSSGRYVHLIPASLDREIFHAKPREDSGKLKVAIMVRPNTPWRGPDRAVELANRLEASLRAECEVHLFGCAASELKKYAPNLSPNIKNHGVLDRNSVASLLRQTDVFVDTSLYQAFGRTALEAMSCGCVPLGPRSGGSREFIVNDINGYCVDSENLTDIEGLISRLAADRNKLRVLRKGALLAASRYNLNDAAAALYGVLEEELKKNSPVKETESQPPAESWPTLTSLQLPPIKKLPLKVLVIAWDIGHNPLGRAYMLAETIERCVRSVTLVGFQYQRYGKDIWEPVRKGRLPVVALKGQNLPALLKNCEELAAHYKPDLVVACKPRLPSLQLALEFKAAWKCPIVFDVDDHELAFFKDKPPMSLDELAASTKDTFADWDEPYSELWTRVSEKMVSWADGVIVSNEALKERFGGLVVPHVRDEDEFDPRKFDKVSLRREYGVPLDKKVLLFFGTPRLHKGLDKLADFVGKSRIEDLILLVVGTAPDRTVTAKLKELSCGKLIMLPNQPFSDVPRILSLADVVCLPQDPSNPISKYQLPAKAIDAVAMNVPLFTTGTPPLRQLIDDQVAVEVDYDDIGSVIQKYLSGQIKFETPVERRVKFLQRYSYDASARSIRELFTSAIKRGQGKSPPSDFSLLKKLQQQKFSGVPSDPNPRRELAFKPGAVDVVVLWKQNDSGLYGRRNDMVTKYLASRDDVARVFVIDSPLNEHDLERMKLRSTEPTQDREVYTGALRKVFGQQDAGKVIHGVYLYPAGKYQSIKLESDRPPLHVGFVEYLENFFAKHKINAKESVFWIYPRHFEAPQVIRHFQPKKVVADIVDDHRAWPGITEREHARLTTNYSEIIKLSNFQMVNCQPMQEAMREFNVDADLIPNGCDDQPSTVEPSENALYSEVKAFPGKVIGFVGNLEKKIDIELLESVATEFPDCLLVLAGSTHAYPEVLELKRFKNVRMPGVVPYSSVGSWIKHFDVALIPHRKMDMTQFMNPLKLFVYLSWRVPVVSTEIYNVDKVEGLVSFGASHEEFLANLRESLAGEAVESERFDAYIRQNSWAARLKGFVDSALTT